MKNDFEELRSQLLNSFQIFTRTFYKLRTGRDFQLSSPPGRESHYDSICKALVRVFKGECKRLIINVPPRYGKTELLIHFVAWSMAWFKDSNYIYVSYSHSLAKKQTQTIKQIIEMPEYKDFFDVHLKDDTSAKDNFENTDNGTVYATGAGGSITGRGAGINGASRFGGAIIIDDIIKPDDASSDTIREGINEWFHNTLQSRVNNPNTPIIFIGQRVHENDLAGYLLENNKNEWETLILPAIDLAGNPLHPQMHDLKNLCKMEQESPYVFAAQYQQDPQPAGGGIFKSEWFKRVDFEPNILSSFIIVDGAETENEANDATVFSHFGLYKVMIGEIDTGLYGLHWIDCVEEWYEPKDLEPAFLSFYSRAMQHNVKPQLAAIEKKSTGSTLLSLMKKYPGLNVVQIENKVTAKNKISRFLEAQPFVAQGLITVLDTAEHADKVIEHCRKITLNRSHLRDDIADTLAYAINIGLINKIILNRSASQDHSLLAKNLMSKTNKINQLQQRAYQR